MKNRCTLLTTEPALGIKAKFIWKAVSSSLQPPKCVSKVGLSVSVWHQ